MEWWSFCLLAMGVSGAIVGTSIVVLFPVTFDAVFNSLMHVYPGSLSYLIWKDLPIPMYMRIYYWNVTNYQDILDRKPGVKPKVEEIGPYVFEEHHVKVNETWDNETVTFYQVKTWKFLEEESVGSLEDEIINVNIIALAASEYARYRDQFYTETLNNLLVDNGAKLFLRATVRELTFEGVEDEILAVVDEFPPNINLPIPYDKFGWFYTRNDSAYYDGEFTMYTGVDDIMDVGQIYKWRGEERIPDRIYTGYCAELNGSAGEFFPPKRDKTYVDFFTPDLCRSIRFSYASEKSVSGVPGFNYQLDDVFLSNASLMADNACFNPFPAFDFWLPNGLLNVSACKFDAPAYISFPHFYRADPALREAFEEGSFMPDDAKHSNGISLEPGTGVPLEVKVRMQINTLLRPLEVMAEDDISVVKIDMFEGFAPTVYPLIWFETSTELDDELAKYMRLVVRLDAGVSGAGWTLMALGLVLVALGIFFAVRYCKRKKMEKLRASSQDEKSSLVVEET